MLANSHMTINLSKFTIFTFNFRLLSKVLYIYMNIFIISFINILFEYLFKKLNLYLFFIYLFIIIKIN